MRRLVRWCGRASTARWVGATTFVAALVGVVAYASTFDDHLVSDDFDGIWESAEGRTSWWALSRPGSFWRPVSRLSHLVVYRLVGLEPFGHHLVNVVAHVASTVLVVLVAETVLRRYATGSDPGRQRAAAALAGAIFAVLPQHAEAAAWVSGRNDSLATPFALAAIAVWSSGWSWRRRTLSAVPLLALALLAKESAVVVPAMLVLLATVPAPAEGRTGARHRAAATWPLWIVVAADLLARAAVVGDPVGGYERNARGPLGLLANAVRLVVRSFVPALPAAAWGAVAAGLVVLVVATARRRDAFAGWGGWRVPGVLGGLVVVGCLPVVGLGIVLTDTRGDRLVHLPSAFAAILVALVAAEWWGRRPVATAVALVVVLAACGGLLLRANADWGRAGQVVERLVDGACRLDPSRSHVLLNLPDRVGGAYAGRNALDAAVSLECPRLDPGDLSYAASHTVTSPGDDVEVSRLGPRRWSIRIDEALELEGVPGRDRAWRVPGVEVHEVSDHELEVEISMSVEATDVWVFDRGSWVRLLAA